MARVVSTQVKIRQLQGLLGTPDVKPHEERFITSLQGYLPPGDTGALSEKQQQWMEDLWTKHFA